MNWLKDFGKILIKWFNNLRIVYKLTISFFIISIFIGLVGFIGISNMGKINSNAVSMYDYNLVSLNKLNDIKNNSQQVYSEILILTYARDINKIKRSERHLNELKNENNQYIKEFEDLGLAQNVNVLMVQYKKYLEDYVNSYSKLVELAKDHKYEEAEAILPDVSEIETNMADVINSIINLNIKHAYNANINNKSIYRKSLYAMTGIIISGLSIAIMLGFLISYLISKQINKVLDLGRAIGKGDLTQKISINTKDEIGKVSTELSRASENTRRLIMEITGSSEKIALSSNKLSSTIKGTLSRMQRISEAAEQIYKGTEELGTTSEEVGASAEEIMASIDELGNKAKNGSISSKQIKERAIKIKEKCVGSINTSKNIYKDKHTKILKAIEELKVVDEVKSMAKSISSIAAQTSLLALNASIEAARAGEHGRGFAVIANDIRKLSEKSNTTARSINKTMIKLEEAFNDITINAQDILDFIENNANPDYKLIIETGMKYEDDAKFVSKTSEEMSLEVSSMITSVKQISNAVYTIALTSQKFVSGSKAILDSINDVKISVEDATESIEGQTTLVEKFNTLVKKFKI
ncbi:MAG: methyl-accepting chemotaxis protein [Clostridiales bacterium]|nr:methyl-accepting chemotaxis protein [Clostridiales bacterium]